LGRSMRPPLTFRDVVMASIFCALCFGMGCGVGCGMFIAVDRLFDPWPHEPPFHWVGPLLLMTYGGGAVGAVAGLGYQWKLHPRKLGR